LKFRGKSIAKRSRKIVSQGREAAEVVPVAETPATRTRTRQALLAAVSSSVTIKNSEEPLATPAKRSARGRTATAASQLASEFAPEVAPPKRGREGGIVAPAAAVVVTEESLSKG